MDEKVTYVLGSDSAMILNYNTDDHSVVKGISGLTPPGFTREEISIPELRREFDRKFNGSGTYNDLTFSGTYVLKDSKGQNLLKKWCYDNTELKGREILCFFNYEDFFTTDLSSDANSSIQIGGFTNSEAEKNSAYTFSGTLRPNGQLAVYTAHAKGTTLAFVEGATANDKDKITDSASKFIENGFEIGMSILILDSASNDQVYTKIESVVAGEITLESSQEITAEAGTSETEVHGGGL